MVRCIKYFALLIIIFLIMGTVGCGGSDKDQSDEVIVTEPYSTMLYFGKKHFDEGEIRIFEINSKWKFDRVAKKYEMQYDPEVCLYKIDKEFFEHNKLYIIHTNSWALTRLESYSYKVEKNDDIVDMVVYKHDTPKVPIEIRKGAYGALLAVSKEYARDIKKINFQYQEENGEESDEEPDEEPTGTVGGESKDKDQSDEVIVSEPYVTWFYFGKMHSGDRREIRVFEANTKRQFNKLVQKYDIRYDNEKCLYKFSEEFFKHNKLYIMHTNDGFYIKASKYKVKKNNDVIDLHLYQEGPLTVPAVVRNDAYGQVLAVSKEYDKGVKNVGIHFKNYAEYKEANDEEFNE